ncbi:hypothetical protein MNB_SV-3-1456 [hydrothermal vent metagenome]|uniref:DUF945 domain-containing protein n=1 Tax=hydrothermal vent metagenome TaxID=652676 RepID=A0A1W1C0E2_9ZZZZ
MKKIGFGLLGILTVATIYYFTAGAEQLATQMKKEVTDAFASLQTQGFGIKKSVTEEKKEHYTLSLNEPQKVTSYLRLQGVRISQKDIQALQGLTLGIDVSYLANNYSAVSFDIYPLTLPTLLTASADNKEKRILKQIQKMIQKKTFLLHMDVNKLGTGFKGYMKDINEIIADKKKVTLSMKGFTFTGEIKENKLLNIRQKLKNITIQGEDEVAIQCNHLISNYTSTGHTKYDYHIDYRLKEILFSAKALLKLHITNIAIDSHSKVINTLAAADSQTKIESIVLEQRQKESRLESLLLEIKAKNIDTQALEKLETIDPKDEKALLKALQTLISKGFGLEIPNFSAKNIIYENQKLDAFKISSHLDIDKTLDVSTLRKTPMAAINSIDADLHLSLSNQLFNFLSKQPQAMLVMMLFQPKDVNNQKVYNVELKDGTLRVNGKQAM